MKRFRTAMAAGALALAAAVAGPAVAQDAPQAPFGDKVSAAFVNYNRAFPTIATAGLLKAGAVAEAKRLGFKTVVDLRGPEEEGVAAEREAVAAAGLDYVSIPVTTRAPTMAQVAEFASIADDATRHPILLHCVSANRAGGMWALYRASEGVPVEVAIEEGRTNGLTSREPAVRARLDAALPTE